MKLFTTAVRTGFAGALALGLALGTGCSRPLDELASTDHATPSSVKVRVAAVRIGTMPQTVELVGTLYGDEELTLSAKVPGRVVRLLADVGDRLAPGAVLARIDPTDYELLVEQREMALRQALAELGLESLPTGDFDVQQVPTVDRARYEAANAKAKMDRARRLFEQQPPLISEQDFQDLETAWQVAQRNRDVAALEARSQLALARSRASELDAARQRLSDATVRVPDERPDQPGATSAPSTRPVSTTQQFAVSGRLVNQGEYVREGDPLFKLVADDPIKFRGAVPERYASKIAVGQVLTLRVEGRGKPFSGRVTRINPAIDINTRTFSIEAVLDNASRALRPGAFARGTVLVGEESDISYVPKAAILTFAGTDKLFTVDQNGKALEHRVTLLARDGDELPVLETIHGDVIVTNTGQLATGTPIQVVTTPAAGDTTQPSAPATSRAHE